jgi:hypothetical protein
MQRVGFHEPLTSYLKERLGAWSVVPAARPHLQPERQMDIIEIKNLTTEEILALKERLETELKFREGIGRDIDLILARKLKTRLEKELTQQELMSDRVLVRKDLHEVKKDITRLEKETADSNKPADKDVIQEHEMTWGKEYE